MNRFCKFDQLVKLKAEINDTTKKIVEKRCRRDVSIIREHNKCVFLSG